MSNQNKGALYLGDLANLSSFEKWLRNNIRKYAKTEIGGVSFDELLIFLNYIEQQVENNNKTNRQEWRSAISKVRRHIESQKG
jgi:hypothetical protein